MDQAVHIMGSTHWFSKELLKAVDIEVLDILI